MDQNYDCVGCGIEIIEDEVNWATEDGKLTVLKGDPYCDACLPEEEGE